MNLVTVHSIKVKDNKISISVIKSNVDYVYDTSSVTV